MIKQWGAGWTNPSGDFGGVSVRRAAGPVAAATPAAGSAVYSGTATSVTASGLTGGAAHSFAVFTKDTSGRVVSRKAVTAAAGAPSPTASSLARPTVSAMRVVYGTTVTARSALTRRDTGRGLAGQTVYLEVSRHGANRWSRVFAAITSTTGAAAFTYKPAWHADLRVRYLGATSIAGSTSSVQTIPVRSRVTAAPSRSTVGPRSTVTFAGKVYPAHGSKYVVVQRRSSKGWTNVASVRLSSTSTYSVRLRAPSAGGSTTSGFASRLTSITLTATVRRFASR
jgi:serine protease